jgi:formaldehyde-activating enzyme involved in methanogenesis
VLCFGTLLAFSSSQTETVCIVVAFSLRKSVVDCRQIYKRNETNMCIAVSVTMNTAYVHISHHTFLKHTYACYSFAV